MKKIISMLVLVAVLVSMCSFSAFADYASTLTLVTSATDNKANAGDEVIASVSLGTSKGIKTLGFKIAFNSSDFELGVSADAADYYMNPEMEVECNEDYEGDWEALTKDYCGHYSYVDDTYSATYKTYVINEKSLGTATIGYAADGDNTEVAFGYAMDATIKTAKATTDMSVGGIVLKVKTTEVKQSTITITEATASGSDGIDTKSTVNEITLNLNGYGEVVEEETPAEKINLLTANGVAKSDVYVTNDNGSKYYVDSALVFVSSVDKGNTPVKTVITCDEYPGIELPIPVVTEPKEINGLTYFAAAMSSIKETNYGKTFKATAYVTNADGEVVVGVPATGIFTK